MNEEIELKVSELVECWADEFLPGRPALLAVAMAQQVRKLLTERTAEIIKAFPV